MSYLKLEDLDKFAKFYYEDVFEDLLRNGGLPNFSVNDHSDFSCIEYMQEVIKCYELPDGEMYRAVMNFYKNSLKNNGFINGRDSLMAALSYRCFGVDSIYYTDITTEELEEAIIQNAGDIDAITNIFKGIYEKGNIQDIKELNKAKEVFDKVVQKGLNIEQIKLRLLVEERAITEQLAKEGKKSPKEREDFLIKDAKNELTKIYGFTRDLEKMHSPYDKLFNISTQIAELKRANNKISNNINANDLDFKQYDANENRIYELEDKLAKEMSKFDPRIVEDAINDKIASAELELEIDQIKKGREVSKEDVRLMPKEIADLRTDLLAIRKQVKKDIKILEQNNEHNV
ncbi:MAG: hypothetical protein E7Z91_07300 [Cyanobacteria bacterium SIG30]|nr:hypothetical protein [Cyanobacteria bacterium SIG30]